MALYRQKWFCFATVLGIVVFSGLTYLDGRFMYHAWNVFSIGHWVTGDAVFNQVPADVTHVGIMTSENETRAALAGILLPDTGTVRIAGIDLNTRPPSGW